MLASGANNAYLLPAHHVHGVALALLRTHVANTKCGHHKSCRAQRRFSCASESSARRACTRGAQLHGQASGRIILFLSTAYSGGNSSLSFVSSQVWRRGVGSARAIDNTYRCMEALVSHLSIATRLVAFAKMCPLPAATAFGSARSTCAKSGVSYARHRRHTDSTLFAQQKWAPRALCSATSRQRFRRWQQEIILRCRPRGLSGWPQSAIASGEQNVPPCSMASPLTDLSQASASMRAQSEEPRLSQAACQLTPVPQDNRASYIRQLRTS